MASQHQKSLIPQSWFSFPYSRFPSFLENAEEEFSPLSSWQNLFKNDVQIESDDKTVTVKVPMPGLETNEIQVSLKDGVLYIHGEKSEEKKEQEKNRKIWLQASRSYSRTITLPEQVDENNVNAYSENGLLTIELAKTKKTETKKINVSKKGTTRK